MMVPPKQSIFREHALERYLKKREQGVLLRLVAPPTLMFCWILLLLLLGAGVFAWFVQVPVFVAGQGVLRNSEEQSGQVKAILFLPPNQLARLHSGQSVKLGVGSTSIALAGIVDRVEEQIIGPQEAQTRFNLQGSLTSLITGPSAVISVRLTSDAPAASYEGSVCSAQVQIGSQNVLSLLPGLKQMFSS